MGFQLLSSVQNDVNIWNYKRFVRIESSNTIHVLWNLILFFFILFFSLILSISTSCAPNFMYSCISEDFPHLEPHYSHCLPLPLPLHRLPLAHPHWLQAVHLLHCYPHSDWLLLVLLCLLTPQGYWQHHHLMGSVGMQKNMWFILHVFSSILFKEKQKPYVT